MAAKAAKFLRECDTIVIGAGAGFGRDSGLPDFRGNEGFWKAYPPYRNKLNFMACANPDFLLSNPNLFWGFYGSRLQMYREKQPHEGFQIIRELARKMSEKGDNLFAVTSNVDGHFGKAGYKEDCIFEVHGSIHFLQCGCGTLQPNHFQPNVDLNQMSCTNLPKCQQCKQIQRPNILMFNDWSWDDARASQQRKAYSSFLSLKEKQEAKIAIVEVGCGSAVPTMRSLMEQLYYRFKSSKLIRINLDPSESSAQWMEDHRYVDVFLSAKEALQQIQKEYTC